MKDIILSEVFSRRFGVGPRQVLAVHCSLAHSGAWRGLATEMEGEITLTAFDMFSHGRSPDWDEQAADYQSANVAAGLAQLRAAGAPMDLIGHSFGATVALRMAQARPDLVNSLTLIEPVLFAVTRQDAPDAQAALEAIEAPFVELYAAGDIEGATRFFNRMWGTGKPKWPDLTEQARAAMIRAMAVVPKSYETLYLDNKGVLKPSALAAVSMPVLLLSGADSQPVMPLINAGLARRLPQAQSVVVPETGHMLPITHPVATADLLRRFWGQAAG
ncbi:alpha/beta fold hydrolase [Pseudophaeobacter flagellatus]|uniref:alpha/beta fold hydrolase n=1 Tax=Pseudophaeobacter flagellatus TaxID=2899119 RepID=UPI001E41AFAA|nr:alpha/beta hydrolase [Pseudophaeobacter flagellatus]MCD9149565.1 alpha/beta hydrolase [Pseudophaeobacter flagellatus]